MEPINKELSNIHKIGKTLLRSSGTSKATFEKLNTFLSSIAEKHEDYFTRELNIGLQTKNMVVCIEDEFNMGKGVGYIGMDMPPGWTLRSYSGKSIYYSPRQKSFVVLKGDANNLDSTYYTTIDNYFAIRHGALDLLQFGTNSIIGHGSIIEDNGKFVAIIGSSGSGKTTLVAQLIKADIGIRLVSEDRFLLTRDGAFSLSYETLLRKESSVYIGTCKTSDTYVDFRDHVDVLTVAPHIDLTLTVQFNPNMEYGTEVRVPLIKPTNRDWPAQAFTEEEFKAIIRAKSNVLKGIEANGYGFRFSTDYNRTAEMFRNMVGV